MSMISLPKEPRTSVPWCFYKFNLANWWIKWGGLFSCCCFFFRLLLFCNYSTPIERKSCAKLLRDSWNSSGVQIPSIQMVAIQFKCCVMWQRKVEVGPFFRDVWTALLTSIVDENPTKTALEIWVVSSGLETTIHTVWQTLMTSYWELTWKTLKGTSLTLSTRHLRWQTRLTSISFWLEITEVPLVTAWLGDIP